MASEVHDSNPLPPEAHKSDSTPPVITDSSDSNPLPQNQPSKPVAEAKDDPLIQAVGYLPGIFTIVALIGLLGQNQKARFHGGQAIGYWVVVYLGYLVLAFVVGFLTVATLGLGALLGIAVIGLYGVLFGLAIPIYLAYKTYQGKNVVLPVIGKFVAEKVGYSPR